MLAATAAPAVTAAWRWRPSCPLVSPPVSRDRLLKLVAIGTAAGAFSGLLGVGGGTVIVPLLILWLGYGEREATGTSLAAIVVIAALATAGQGLYGNVDVANAIVVGVPAMAGVIAGTALQQRLPERAVALLFAALLVATAVALLLP
ncbi:MAG: sulfite exporter TauE/SafE family protein [Actinomycetota bacterium]